MTILTHTLSTELYTALTVHMEYHDLSSYLIKGILSNLNISLLRLQKLLHLALVVRETQSRERLSLWVRGHVRLPLLLAYMNGGGT